MPGHNRDRATLAGAPASRVNPSNVAGAVLLRISAQGDGGLADARIARDLLPFVSHRLSPNDWRGVLNNALDGLEREHCIERAAGKVKLCPAIWARRDDLLGCRLPRRTGWAELRDIHWVAHSLDIVGEPRRRLGLAQAENLRRAVLESSFGVRFRDGPGYAALRDGLARLALRLGTVTGDGAVATALLNVRQRRQQAASLLPGAGSRRPPGSDVQLVATIAAQQAGAKATSAAALRQALLRRHLTGEACAPAATTPVRRMFDLGEFLMEVRNFARQVAQGWQGNRRALISRVFPALAGAHPEWGLDVTNFKSLLAEAHRAGRLSLVNADLRDRGILAELQASAVAYHNMIMHFIRVEDEASNAA